MCEIDHEFALLSKRDERIGRRGETGDLLYKMVVHLSIGIIAVISMIYPTMLKNVPEWYQYQGFIHSASHNTSQDLWY